MIPFGKSILWFLFISLFSLLQLWVIMVMTTININLPSITSETILFSGSLLFFSTALVSSISIDYHFINQSQFFDEIFSFWDKKFISEIIFGFFPFMVIILCLIMFITIYGKNSSQINLNNAHFLEHTIIVITTVYSIISKAFLFVLND